MENYFFDTEDITSEKKVFTLIIYDVVENKRRIKLAKLLLGYGFRVQKSAFEAMISKKKYQELIRKIPHYVAQEDSVKVYKIIGKGQVESFGTSEEVDDEEIILI